MERGEGMRREVTSSFFIASQISNRTVNYFLPAGLLMERWLFNLLAGLPLVEKATSSLLAEWVAACQYSEFTVVVGWSCSLYWKFCQPWSKSHLCHSSSTQENKIFTPHPGMLVIFGYSTHSMLAKMSFIILHSVILINVCLWTA